MTVNSLGQESDPSSRTAAERLLPLFPIGVAMFTLSALLYYHLYGNSLKLQSPPQLLVAWIYQSFGFAPAMIGFLLLLTWGSIWFVIGVCERPLGRLGRLLALVVLLGVFLNLGDGGVSSRPHTGALGAHLAGTLVGMVGYYPTLVLVWVMTVAALMLATDFFFRDAFERLRERRADAGVEAEVTDHLKGLAGFAPATPATTSLRPAMARSAARQGVDEDTAEAAGVDTSDADVMAQMLAVAAREADDEVEVQPRVEMDEPQQVARRRESYFERRREAQPLLEEDGGWVPMAPESQDIDNPEAPRDRAPHADLDEADAEDDADLLDAFVVSAQTGDGAEEDVEIDPEADEDAAGAIESDAGVPRSLAADWFPVEEPAAEAEVEAEGEVEDDQAEGDEVEDEVAAAEGDDLRDEAEFAAGVSGVAPAQPQADQPRGGQPEDAPSEDEEPAVLMQRPDDQTPFPEVAASDLLDEAAPTEMAEPEADEPLVSIPRPATAPTSIPLAAARQQRLFGEQFDEALLGDAEHLVRDSRRASANLLQRKLRIDFDTARRLLAELAVRGVVELDEDAVHGRVLD